VVVHAHDPRGGVDDRQFQRFGDRRHRPAGGVGVERHLAAEKGAGIQESEHHVGIGDGRLGAAPRVGGRTGRRTGRPRPHPEAAVRRDPGDRAAAAGDRPSIQVRLVERVLVHHLLAGHDGTAVDHQADLERGPAHVSCDHVGVPGAGGQHRDAADPAGRARADQLDRTGASVGDVGNAPVGLHHQQLTGEPRPAQPVSQAIEIRHRSRADVGIDHRGHRALVLTLAGSGLRGEADERIRSQFGHELGDAPLVDVVAERPQQRHRDALELPAAEQSAQHLASPALIQGRDDGAVGAHPLVELADRRPWHERRRLARRPDVEYAIDREPGGAAGAAHHPERVGMAGGGDERDTGTATLDQQVRPDRGAVAESLGLTEQLVGRHADPGRQPRQRLQHRVGGVPIVGRERLGVVQAPFRVDPHAVGEGAADVDSDGPGHVSPLAFALPSDT
jgi:hypothetical protein